MRTKIIAEAASNHKGDIELAKEMVHVAKEIGCDIVKFQSWQSKNLRPGDPGYARYKSRELSDEDLYRLKEECEKTGIEFLVSVFDIGRIAFLRELGLHRIKVPSPDCGSRRMLELLRKSFEEVIVSTGMSFEEDVQTAAEALKGHNFVLLHCVSLYPTPLERVNLARMEWLRQFCPKVGYSDHTLGTAAGKLAIAMGAVYLEKHFCLERDPNDKFGAMAGTPDEFRELVDYAEEVEILLGSPTSEMSEEEKKMREIYVGRWGDNR